MLASQLQLLNDQPGTLLVCEFDWAFNTYNPRDATADAVVNVQYKSLEDSLRTRRVAHFSLEMKIRRSKPRAEFANFGYQDLEGALARRLTDEAFEEEEYFAVDLKAGNFAPDHDTNDPKSAAFGRTRWGLRLSFRNKSPVPSLSKWKQEFHGMVEAQNWEACTKWYSQRLPES